MKCIRAAGVFFTLVQCAYSLGCMDESGREVDWWWMLKRPIVAGHDHSIGFTYVYMTSKTRGAFVNGTKAVTSEDSLLGQVLKGVYSGSVKNFIMYNDQQPDGKESSTYGHSKGYMGWDDKEAFWVQHSIPHFPNYVGGSHAGLPSGYKFQDGEGKNGQHAFCMSMTKANVDEVAAILKFSRPWVYSSKTDKSLKTIEEVIAEQHETSGKTTADIKMPWGTVHLFGKTAADAENMAHDVIAPALKEDMLSQSWLNGGGPFGSYCPKSGYSVEDIQEVELEGVLHDTHKDHSKWLVASDKSNAWACGLDNNHVKSQMKRAGLAACVQIKNLADNLRTAAKTVASCKKEEQVEAIVV
mmetsp:Transcript_43274/g.78776  ORF Transcript_43274/g.78776 Transcript_43274/m.78776 type:complete len:355 (-) Transcript_43274:91-1155(-)